MKRTLSEKKVLKKLGIPDFRHMTKDKIMKFASVLPYMDPEVAKKALEQFPTFKDLASDVVNQYKSIVEKALEGNEVSQNAFYEACNSIISSLQQELSSDNITQDDRIRIEDKMIKVAEMIGEKDSENKGFLLKTVGIVAGALVTITATAAALLGSNSQIEKKDSDEYSADEDENDNDDTRNE